MASKKSSRTKKLKKSKKTKNKKGTQVVNNIHIVQPLKTEEKKASIWSFLRKIASVFIPFVL